MSRRVLVFLEIRDGEVKPASLQALTGGRLIAESWGATLDAVAVGSACGSAVELAMTYDPSSLLARLAAPVLVLDNG